MLAPRLGARTVCCRLGLLLPSTAPLRQKAAQEPRILQDAPCPPQDPATGTPASNLPVRPVPWPRLWRARPGRTPPSQPNSPALLAWYPPFQSPSHPPSYLLPPALRQSCLHTHPQPDLQRLGPPPRCDPHPQPGQAKGRRAAGDAAGELTRSPEPCPGRLPALARSFRPRAAAAGAATEASSARPRASAPPLGSSPEAGPELAGRGWASSRLDLDGTRAPGKGPSSPSTTTFEQLEIESR